MNQLTKTAERTPTETRAAVAWATPRANIHEGKEAYMLELEMPGVPKEGLEITIENNELTIIGRRSDPEPAGELVYRETRPLNFRRVFDLDPSIDTTKISAKIDKGVVTLTLPKAERVKPRKITVS
ncbi:MAG: Hsp20/alpha crystallin family protein [Verrucomicrobiota bacterium]